MAILPARLKLRLHQFWERHGLHVGVAAFIVIFLVVYLAKSIFIIIEAGHAGVLYRRFWGGTQTNRVYGEGLQIIAPWNVMNIHNVRLQQVEHTFSIISSNGLTIGVTVSIRFRPKIEELGVLHKEVGPDYVVKIIIPEVQSLVRNVFGHYSPEEIYTTKRSVVQNAIQGALDEVGERYVLLDDLLIKTITLPASIQAAIESKLTEEQRMLEMTFRIQRERREAERKIIEADGVNASQQIIAESLNDQLLRYKGIEATLELAKSENAKIVIIGHSPEGLPVILDSSTETLAPKKTR